MGNWAVAAAGLGLVAFFVWAQRQWQNRQIAVSRIPTVRDPTRVRVLHVGEVVRWYEQLLPWILGIAGMAAILFFTSLNVLFALSVGVLGWVIGYLILTTIVGRRTLQLEAELAEAIDHVVTSLHAGVGVLDALQSAEQHARKFLKPHLATLVSRIRLGDDPVEVCRELAQIVPLESFRLFYYALAVQWEGGGNLAPTLATTGRFIRDRVEVGRRVRAHTTEARFSVIMVLLLTYLLALLMWRMSPDKVEGFLNLQIGQNLAAAAIILQALGAVWIARMSRIRY